MNNLTFDGIKCSGCTEGIDMSQTSTATATVEANIDSIVTADFITKFKQKSNQMIDVMIEEQREFMSPENKRKTQMDMKSDMDQIVENTFTVTNLTNIVNSFTGLQAQDRNLWTNMDITCPPAPPNVKTYCINLTQDMQVDLVSKAVITQTVDVLMDTDLGQDFIQRSELIEKFKSTGPIGEYFRGIAGILNALMLPMVIGAVVAALVFVYAIMSKKKPGNNNNGNFFNNGGGSRFSGGKRNTPITRYKK